MYFVPKSEAPAGQEPQRVWSPAPLYLQEGARRLRIVPVPWLDALYVQKRTHLDGPDEPIAEFRRDVDAAVEAQQPRNLIVDLRFDTGGNIDLTRQWQRALAERIRGRLYVLVGPYTFSAGIVAAAAFKHDAGERARIVGDAVGDRMRWWSEGEDVCLPESHYCLHRTTGLWDLAHDCAAEPACYGDK